MDVIGHLPNALSFIFYDQYVKKEGLSLERQTITVKELANYLGVHTDTIYAMVKQKQIPHLKIQNRILFTREAIDLWIQDQEYTSLHH